jgi:NAD(P)H-quinone oxidoreductase subunit 5
MSPDTESLTPLLAAVAPAALLLVAAFAAVRRGPRPRLLERAAVGAAALGVLVAPALALLLATRGTLVTPLVGSEAAGLGLSLRLDPLSVTLFSMVAFLGLVVVRFSRTYLDGDPRQGVFLGRLAMTLASVEVLVLAGNLALFFAAWVATSLTLHSLLVFYPERRGARVAARKKLLVARLGDLAILGAGLLIYRQLGTGDLGAILAAAPGATGQDALLLAVAAALLAIAAILKSAQFPTHGWLVEVMETPTPVSALLHAGILNAGPFLVVRFAAVMQHGAAAPTLLVVFGGFTALFASVVLLTQPAVKVALGYSSAAHMGFMLLVCGLGVYPAAILHLVAHSFYKAHAFLSSGSAVESILGARVRASARLRHPLRVAASVGLALALYVGFAALYGVEVRSNPALLAVGAILVMGLAQLLAPALDSATGLGVVARTAGLAGLVALAFFTLEHAAAVLLAPVLPPERAPNAVTVGLAAVVVVAFGFAVFVQITGGAFAGGRLRHAAYVHLRNGLYANALFDRLVGAFRR